MYYLNVGDGHHLQIERFNHGNGAPYLFVHGGPGSSPNLLLKNSLVNCGMDVLFMSQRACPGSLFKDPLLNNATNFLVDDILSVLKHEKITQVNLVASSWGCTLALLFAYLYPSYTYALYLRAPFLSTFEEIEFLYFIQKNSFSDLWFNCFDGYPSDCHENFFSSAFEAFKSNIKTNRTDIYKNWIEWELNLGQNKDSLKKLEITEADKLYCLIQAHFYKNQMFLGDCGVSNILKGIEKDIIAISSKGDNVTSSDLGRCMLCNCDNISFIDIEDTPHSVTSKELSMWLPELFGFNDNVRNNNQ